MWEKLLIRLAALYWASGIVFLFLAGRMFKEFVRRKESGGKPDAVPSGLPSPRIIKALDDSTPGLDSTGRIESLHACGG